MRNRKQYWGKELPYSTWERRMPDGRRWYVGAGLIEYESFNSNVSEAQVVVPVERLGGLTDEQIGEWVRSLVRDAQAVHAVALANDLLDFRGEIFKNYRDHRNYALEVKEFIEDFVDYPGIDRKGVVRKALQLVSDLGRHVERKEKGKAAKRYERAAATKDFDALFVAVGRRDGFKCAACGSVDRLQLDHIEPVTLGGETHPNNLQLLCQPCNLRKGERTIDYRGTQNTDTVQ